MGISPADKKIMYSLYQNDKVLTYKSIAELFRPKYKDINERVVADICHEYYNDNENIINFNSDYDLINPVKIIRKSDNMQATRRSSKEDKDS